MKAETVHTERLDKVRTAIDTARAISSLKGFPHFIHKWTREMRRYTLRDLALPQSLFVNGHWPAWNSPVVGVGGTRTPTVETFCLVSNVVKELARGGVLIVSGGVPGVDLAAHIAAADEPLGRTIAILANPAERGLGGHEWSSVSAQDQILKRGAFASEYSQFTPFGSDEFRERLLARDRIISGLSDIFLVFECNENSATVDTARRALMQGKGVVCINSTGTSARHGVEQLASELNMPVLDARNLDAVAIARRVARELAHRAGATAAIAVSGV